MSEVNGNAHTNVAEAPAEAAEELPKTDPSKEQLEQPEQARFGVDPSKRFIVVQIPLSFGFYAIIGYLGEVQDWVKSLEATRRRDAASQQSGVIKPGHQKGRFGGRFNIFKR